MKDVASCIEELQLSLERHRKENIKEYPTRVIFIDPMLQALGWDVRDPDEVQLEYPTVDGKSVDYAPKINRKVALFIEAKALNDPLTDVKKLTQIIAYATNAGLDWCILTNGVIYKVYRSTEKAEAPDKLLFEVSIDPKETKNGSVHQIAEQLNRFSRDAMARGVLDKIGEQIFTTGKIRKALDKLFINPPPNLIKIIRSVINDESVKPIHVKSALKRILSQSSDVEIPSTPPVIEKPIKPEIQKRKGKKYGEEHHITGKPQEVIELFRTVDKFCRELAPGIVQKEHRAKSVNYKHGKSAFCSVHIQKGGLRIWVRLNYSRLENPSEYVRDVSNIGHWGSGDVEIRINNFENFQSLKYLIRQSFDENK
jgi:hypothetical protein